jgi:hypothetical protein
MTTGDERFYEARAAAGKGIKHRVAPLREEFNGGAGEERGESSRVAIEVVSVPGDESLKIDGIQKFLQVRSVHLPAS